MSSIDDRIQKWIRPVVRDLVAYHVPDAQGFVKLDAMENPYTWPEDKLEQWLDVLRQVPLNRYPDPSASELRDLLHSAMQVPDGFELMLGNGSDELIQIILMAVSGTQRAVMAPEPSFVMYKMIAGYLDMPFVGVPLRADFSLDREVMLRAIEQHQPAVIFLAYPNNPTGNLFAAADIDAMLAASDGLVVLDEAYHAFAGETYMSKLAQHDNLLVMRTLSKMGLAGLRLGLLAGDRRWLHEFDKLRLPYNINVLTQASARYALEHQAMLDEQTRRITQDREKLLLEMKELPGIEVFPSQANFILFRTRAGMANGVFESLKKHKVLIKNLHSAGGLLSDCLRVTVGTAQENRIFLSALKDSLG